MPIDYLLMFSLIPISVYKIMGLYHTNHVTQDVFKFYFISELKFSHVYFCSVISNCASFHHGHAMYPLSLCLSHKSYCLADLHFSAAQHKE